jgi:hypothetical protein
MQERRDPSQSVEPWLFWIPGGASRVLDSFLREHGERALPVVLRVDAEALHDGIDEFAANLHLRVKGLERRH